MNGGDRVEGKVFTTTWGDQSYEIFIKIDRDIGTYEIKVNDELLKKGRLNVSKQFLGFPIERDGHCFFVIIRKYKYEFLAGSGSTVYEFECFANGVALSDGKSTFSDYYEKIQKAPKPHLTKGTVLMSVFYFVVIAGCFISLWSIGATSWSDFLQHVVITITVYLVLFLPLSSLMKWIERKELRKQFKRMLKYEDAE